MVLDVAEGSRLELRQGDRTIHAPNEGQGYRNMPANPKGIAWAIKQYNGFGGNWRPKSASHSILPNEQNADLVLKVLERYKDGLT